ncbi:uncharacterized protein MKK02DRAFT_38750 [Dioszegia hungarica]|uniref:Uncharacterized protein n=1 Tax=Dioszegia hungarica TaxID=4972 RepID=A0AA38LU18_9TREE|nr:uncharacterized protein MKK02DRAFT_38750 [Dioszegia hungarica]KAI9634079.1 hypothetical protein MKK02DRAFT_38750 [Dioszegia hungarica]
MPQIDFHPSSAQLHPAKTGHPATAVWESRLVPALRRMLDRLSVTRAVLHLVRISRPINSSMDWETNSLTEVIVWIGVDTDTAPELASDLVAGTLAELQALELDKVECEVFTSRTISLAGPPVYAGPTFREDGFLPDRAQEIARQFVVGIGLDITPHGSQLQGTGGVFVKLEGRTGIYLLTCHHLLDDDPGAERLIDGYRTGTAVSLCTDASFSKHMDDLGEARRYAGSELERSKGWMERADGVAGRPRRRSLDARMVEHAEKNVLEVDALRRALETEWAGSDNRIVGQAVCYSPVEVSGQDAGLGASEKDEAKLGDVRKPNRSFLDGRSLPGLGDVVLDRDYYEDCAVPVTGIVSICEIGETQTRVFKRGAGTGLTSGVLNPVRSVLRDRRMCDGQMQVVDTWEICAMAWSRPNNTSGHDRNDYGPFCAPGDSGSIVVRVDGRAIGMISRGLAGFDNKYYGDRCHIALVTPIDLIFEDMARRYGLVASLA